MSFSTDIKKELTQIDSNKCCKKAELAAILRMAGSISLNNNMHGVLLEARTENPSLARYTFSTIKNIFSIQSQIIVRRKSTLKKNYVYIVKLEDSAKDVLESLYIIEKNLTKVQGISSKLIRKDCCKKAYLRGAFLAAGSVNNPGSISYHLELITTYENHANALCKLMNKFNLFPKKIERKKGYVIYLKEGDKIGEFLNIIGAHSSLLNFENIRIMKDMRNSVNRLVNCETANLNKTVNAAMKQIKNIKLIDQYMGLENLPNSLREIALTRIKNPEVNLSELGKLVSSGNISKSAVNHRLRKLEKISDDLRGRIEDE